MVVVYNATILYTWCMWEEHVGVMNLNLGSPHMVHTIPQVVGA